MIERRVELRWRDLDALGHVTHSVVLTYLEEGRNAWLALHGIGAEGYVVASAKVDYRREITLDLRSVRARCRVARVGTTSVTTAEQLVSDDGAVLADAAFVLVMWDPQRRGSRPLTVAERAGLERELEQATATLFHTPPTLVRHEGGARQAARRIHGRGAGADAAQPDPRRDDPTR